MLIRKTIQLEKLKLKASLNIGMIFYVKKTQKNRAQL